MNAILLASAGVVILLVGGGLGFWAGRSGVGGGKAKVVKAEAELEEAGVAIIRDEQDRVRP